MSYTTYTNLDFSNVRGITASLSKRFNGRFSFDVDYTFQTADGSNSDPNDAITARLGGDSPRLNLIPLNWDQRHTFNASAFVGGGGWGASLIGRLGSGYPYTPQAVDGRLDRSGRSRPSRRTPSAAAPRPPSTSTRTATSTSRAPARASSSRSTTSSTRATPAASTATPACRT